MSKVPWLESRQSELRLHVHVQPRARRTEVIGAHGERLKIRLKSAPMDGAANSELRSFLAVAFGVPQSHVDIVSGPKSRDKTVAIRQPASMPEWAAPEFG